MIAVNSRTWQLIEIVQSPRGGARLYVNESKTKGFIEITPISRGSLWKVRKYPTFYRVYYGTLQKAYCNDLLSAIKFIQEKMTAA